MARRRTTDEDREFTKQFEKSLKVSSYFDHVLAKVYEGSEIPENMVPDLGSGGGVSSSNESSSLFSLDTDTLFKTAAGAMGPSGMASALPPVPPAQSLPQPLRPSEDPSMPRIKLSSNQANALKRYPALIELLGTDRGEALVQRISSEVNQILVSKIAQNTQALSKMASQCQADKQNIKQWFVSDDESWVACVTASGPFRGDEAFYYKRDIDKSYILRLSGDDYEDVSSQFNMISESARK